MTLSDALIKISKQLAPKIDDALTKEVFQEVQSEEAATIYEEVYKVYHPKMYRRRGDFGGLADPYNIEIRGERAKDGVLVVVNTTEPNPRGCIENNRVTTDKSLPELVEYGYGYRGSRYDFPRSNARYMNPRPFTAKTIEHLKENRAHVSGLKEGLARQGVKVK